MVKHKTRVGLHARNAEQFLEADYELIRRAKIETLKTMSHTSVGAYQRLRQQNPGLEFIVRLYDDRLHKGSRPTPADFVARMVPIINALKPYASKFEIHNEPNHADGIEGWGASDADARAFASWYMSVLRSLKKACPWARFGFPGLAVGSPHRDRQWLAICHEAVDASDFLCCHCYWQYDNMLSDEWGLRFTLFHREFPEKQIEITEFGNSTPGVSAEEIARQYASYYRELGKYYYLGSASAFIASSPDPAWAMFTWLQENGQMMPVVDAVARVDRSEVEVIRERYFPKTRKFVRESFLDFFERYGVSLCGYPITDQLTESGIETQYFQRLAMEEFQPGKIRLKTIGTDIWSAKTKISELESRVAELSKQPLPALAGTVEQLSATVAALSGQVQALQLLSEKIESGHLDDSTELAHLTATLEKETSALQAVSKDLSKELEAALSAVEGEQADLIGTLQAQVKALNEEVERLKTQQPGPAPEPGVHKVSQPTILNITASLPKHPAKQWAMRPLESIKTLVIHHSATKADLPVQSIAQYHIRQWDWAGIGYHYVINGDSTIFQTNDLTSVSSHTANANTRSVGICFLGNFMETVPPIEQVRAGAHLVAWLLQELKLEPEAVKGHQEVVQTACPGKQWLKGKAWKATLTREISTFLNPSKQS